MKATLIQIFLPIFILAVFTTHPLSARADFFSPSQSAWKSGQRSFSLGYRYLALDSGYFPTGSREVQEFPIFVNIPTGNDSNWEIHYIAHRFQRNADDSGDASFFTNYYPFKFEMIQMGARLGLKLPNANQRNGMGTNETDGYFLFSFRSPDQQIPWSYILDAGLGIIGNPQKNSDQLDITFLDGRVGYTFAGTALTAIVGGQAQILGKNYPENGYFYAAADISQQDHWTWTPKALVGFNSHSPRWGGELKLSHSF